ncbi:MAG: Calx-beta domain-containing protein, partial [Snowella sp.]|nr:Calx-beta domain-containing protein [Snowella sp.]
MANKSWKTAVDGFWSVSTNWNPSLPTSVDVALINLAGVYTVTLDIDQVLGGLTLGGTASGTQTLAIASNTLTLNGASTVGNNGVLALSGGTITGTGALTVSGTGKLNWSSGTISGTGKKTISGALNLTENTDGYHKYLDGTTLETSGLTTWTSDPYGLYASNSATWNNTSTGIIDLQGDTIFFADHFSGSGTPSFNNAGTLTKSNGESIGESIFGIIFNNTGTVNVKKGTLTLFAGGTNTKTFKIDAGATLRHLSDYTYNTGSSVTGTGNLLLDGGFETVTVAAASTWSALIVLTGSLTTLTGTGALTISNKLTWNGGTISGTGKKTVSGALNLSGAESLDGTTLETSGATIWTGTVTGDINGDNNVTSYNSAIWNNTSTGNIDLQCDADFYLGSGTPSFNNAGTFTKSNGATDGSDESNINIAFNNTGTVNVKKGTLNLSGGGANSKTFSIDLGATLKHTSDYIYNTGNSVTGTGNLLLEYGTITVAAASTWSAPVTLDGKIAGAGALTISNKLNWISGSISGTGKKTVSGALNLSGVESLDGTTLETNSATIWAGTSYLYGYNGAIWNNTSTGTIDLQGDADFYLYSGTPSFNNAGTFTKSNGATDGSDESYFDVAFNNTGTVNIKKGTLNLSGGGANSKTFSIDLGATLKHTSDYIYNTGNSVTGTGDLLLESGTITVAAASTWSAPVVLTGATLTGAGVLTLSNKLNWSDGTITGTGKKTISGALNLLFNGGYQYLDGTTLETSGATIWTGAAYLYSYNGAIWNNTSTGTIDLQGDGDFYHASGTPSFNNAGTLTKSNGATDGSDESDFDVAFNNTGTVSVKKGKLNLAGGYTQTAGTTNLNGGNLASSSFDLNGGVLTGAGTITGNVNNTGGQVNPGNTVGTLVIDGNYSQSSTGLLNFDLASASSFDQFNVTGEGNFGGTLKVTLGTGYTPTIGTKYTVLTYGTATTKTFNTVQGIDLSAALALAPTSTGNNLILEVVDKVPDLGAVTFGNTKSITDAVGDSDLFDFYRFNVSAAGTVQLKLTNLTANADIWLVDGLGRTLAQGTKTGTADEAVSWAVDAGTYFVKVFRPAAGNNTNYTLQVATTNIPAVITVAATDASAAETATGVTPNPGTFTLTRTGDLSQAITVNYTLAGTATNGTDYTNLPLTATFAAGASTTLVTVTPTDDTLVEATENVILTLATGTGYNLGTTTSATVNIADN